MHSVTDKLLIQIPVDDADGFIDSHSATTLLRAAVTLVLSVHILLSKVTAAIVKMSAVQ